MDPLLLASTFASIVGLVCNFRQERCGDHHLKHSDFVEWLEYHRHEDIKNLILRTHNLPREIDELLRRDQNEILAQLKKVDEVLATVLSKLDGFSGIVEALAPASDISDQAKAILLSFATGKVDLLILMHYDGGELLQFSPGHGHTVEQPRFLHDDIKTLKAYQLIALDSWSGKDPVYKLTRAGAKYAEFLKGQKLSHPLFDC